MRSLFPVLLAPLLIPAASMAQPPAPSFPVRNTPVINPITQGKACPPTSRYEVAKGGKVGAHKLNELPMADGYKAVLRKVDGCNAPILVGYGYGRQQR
jgi:hypothetical protein